jgi:low temperature requirement protein LtrA
VWNGVVIVRLVAMTVSANTCDSQATVYLMFLATVTNGVELFKAYFDRFREIDDQLEG